MRFEIGVAFLLPCCFGDLFIVGLCNFSALAFHVTYRVGLPEPLNQYTTIVQIGT